MTACVTDSNRPSETTFEACHRELSRQRGELLAKKAGRTQCGNLPDLSYHDRAAEPIDAAVGQIDQRIAAGFLEHEAVMLGRIEAALGRIERGTYGVCGDCGDSISPARLKARPMARCCTSCAERSPEEQPILA